MDFLIIIVIGHVFQIRVQYKLFVILISISFIVQEINTLFDYIKKCISVKMLIYKYNVLGIYIILYPIGYKLSA